MLGFRFDETMSGWHILGSNLNLSDDGLDNFKQPMEFKVTWGPDNIFEWLNPFSGKFMKQPLFGNITIEGLGRDIPCKGDLELAYHKGMIRYTIFFTHNGTEYIYIGKKRGIKPWNLHKTHTTCYGELTARTVCGSFVVSQSITYFRLKTLPSFLKSFRFVR